MDIIVDKNLINVADVMEIFSQAEWTKNRTTEDVQKMKSNSDFMVLIKQDNSPIGFARVITDYTYRAFIEDVIVLPVYQFCGIGKLMIHQIENLLKEYNIPRIELSTNKTQFWEKVGYTPKESTTHMIKRLN